MALISNSLWLPDRLYAVVGVETNLYFAAVFNGNAALYDFDVTTTPLPENASRQQDERWTITPAPEQVGTHTLTLNVYLENERVAWRKCTLYIKAAAVQPTPAFPIPVTRKLLVIGDSLTAEGHALAEAVNLAEKAQLNLVTVGTRSVDSADADGVCRTVLSEAVGGKTLAWHSTSPESPFVFGGKFNFSQYLTVNEIALGDRDWVLIFLGANDVFGCASDESCDTQITAMANTLNLMISQIRAAAAGIRIGICLPLPPSDSQDAFGSNYGTGQRQKRYRRNRDLWLCYLLENRSGQDASLIYLVPTHMNLDTARNMQVEEVAVNARNPQQVQRQSNGLHPATAGYFQVADSLFAFLRGQEA